MTDLSKYRKKLAKIGASNPPTQPSTRMLGEYKAEKATIEAQKSSRRSKAIKSVIQAEGKDY